MKDLDRQLRAYYDQMVQRVDPSSPGHLQPEPAHRPRGWAVAGVAAVAVLVVGVVTMLLLDTEPDRADPAATSLPPETTMPPGETTTASSEEPPALLDPVGMETFGDFTFVWNQLEIWRYTNGEWSLHAPAPGSVHDLAYTSGTLWAIFDSGLWENLEDGTWQPVNAGPAHAWRLAAAPDTGILWISTGDDLYRWDGITMTNVGHPPNWETHGGVGAGFVGEITVTSDGTVWAAGLYGYVLLEGGLARYDDTTRTWDVVRPLGGDEDLPAGFGLLAPTPDGDLWVILVDNDDWPSVVFTLVRRDGATGEWTIHALPDGEPRAMAADLDAVWIARLGSVLPSNAASGIARFDGRTWTTYVEDLPVRDITVASDGTVWYSLNGEIHQLVP